MVILSIFANRARRTTSMNKAGTKLAANANVQTKCIEWNVSKDIKYHQWLVLDTASANNEGSGIKVRNYYSSESFDCRYMQSIAKWDGKKRWFFSYRDMSSYSDTTNGSWYQMRQLRVDMKNSVNYYFEIDKGLFSSDMSESEANTMQSNISNNRNTYLTKYTTHKRKMQDTKVKAGELRKQKNRNINSRANLDKAIADTKAEMELSQATLRDLNASAEALRLQIRNYEQEINTVKNTKLAPAVQTLADNSRNMSALQQAVNDNKNKIQGIVKIDSNDLMASNQQLMAKLKGFRTTFLPSDPKSIALGNLIANLETKKDEIPQIVTQ